MREYAWTTPQKILGRAQRIPEKTLLHEWWTGYWGMGKGFNNWKALGLGVPWYG